MDGTTMVVAIVALVMGAKILNTWLKTRAKVADGQTQAAEMAEMAAELDRLAQRVRVLERLATDGDHRLREEFRNIA